MYKCGVFVCTHHQLEEVEAHCGSVNVRLTQYERKQVEQLTRDFYSLLFIMGRSGIMLDYILMYVPGDLNTSRLLLSIAASNSG